jgi:hypothetical protein
MSVSKFCDIEGSKLDSIIHIKLRISTFVRIAKEKLCSFTEVVIYVMETLAALVRNHSLPCESRVRIQRAVH